MRVAAVLVAVGLVGACSSRPSSPGYQGGAEHDGAPEASSSGADAAAPNGDAGDASDAIEDLPKVTDFDSPGFILDAFMVEASFQDGPLPGEGEPCNAGTMNCEPGLTCCPGGALGLDGGPTFICETLPPHAQGCPAVP